MAGNNVTFKVQDGKLTMVIDLTKNVGRSKSGKNTLIATTQGTHKMAIGDKMVSIGLNVYTLDA